MKSIIISFILCFLSAPFAHSDSLTSYIDKNGNKIWTNSAQGNKQRTQNFQQQKTQSTAEAINLRHPEIASNNSLFAYFIKCRDHFVEQGNPLHQAMLRAEQKMIMEGYISNSKSESTRSPVHSAISPESSVIVWPALRGGMIVGGPYHGSTLPGKDGGMVIGGPLNGTAWPDFEGGMIVGGPLNGTVWPSVQGGTIVGGPLNGTVWPSISGGLVVGGPLNGIQIIGKDF